MGIVNNGCKEADMEKTTETIIEVDTERDSLLAVLSTLISLA